MFEKRDCQVGLRLSESERRGAIEQAEREGVALQMWIRFLIRERIGMPCPGKRDS